MAKFQLIFKSDNPGLDQEFVISNIYISKKSNGNLEIHAFGGPDAQSLYDKFIENEKGIVVEGGIKEDEYRTNQ